MSSLRIENAGSEEWIMNAIMRTFRAARVTPAEFHIMLALVDADRHGYAVMQQAATDSQGTVRLGPGTL